jgi:hypothetical protein
MAKKTKQNGIGDLIGKVGLYRVPIRSEEEEVAFKVRVKIIDAKQAFGRTDVKITPEAGEGTAWVSKQHVETD